MGWFLQNAIVLIFLKDIFKLLVLQSWCMRCSDLSSSSSLVCITIWSLAKSLTFNILFWVLYIPGLTLLNHLYIYWTVPVTGYNLANLLHSIIILEVKMSSTQDLPALNPACSSKSNTSDMSAICWFSILLYIWKPAFRILMPL